MYKTPAYLLPSPVYMYVGSLASFLASYYFSYGIFLLTCRLLDAVNNWLSFRKLYPKKVLLYIFLIMINDLLREGEGK